MRAFNIVLLVSVFLCAGVARAAEPVDLKALAEVEEMIQRVLPAARAATVHLRIGFVHGSGVVVSEDGYILTASHVSGQSDQSALVTFPDGTRARAKTLGRLDYGEHADAGVLKLTGDGPWPALPMARSGSVKVGQWCFSLGYPNGFDAERGPVLRVGRIIGISKMVLWSDCTILSGDSGGPLVDLEGRVIGTHSRIARSVEANFHAPIDQFHRHWALLSRGVAFLGVSVESHESGAAITVVDRDSPAEAVGLESGDIITAFDRARVADSDALVSMVRKSEPGGRAELKVQRNGVELTYRVRLGRRWVTRPEPADRRE